MKTLQKTLIAVFFTTFIFANYLSAESLWINKNDKTNYENILFDDLEREVLEEATKVYPNPSTDFFRVEIDSENIKGEMTITLISQTTGEIATSTRFLKMEDFHTEELDLTWAQEGKYTMIITNGRTSIRRNLLKL